MVATRMRTVRTALWHLRRGGIGQFRTWQRRRRIWQPGVEPAPTIRAAKLDSLSLTELFPEQPRSSRRPIFDEIRAGVILDEFSAESFGYEWTLVPLSRADWNRQLDDLDFVFIESAWNGNGGEWKYQLTGDSGLKPDVIALLDECRRRELTTVFWNKEDPPHYDDFLPLAKRCDVVFTSDVRLIPKYRVELGHDRVDVLPFAAQPAIHSPARPARGFAARDIAFAGMYFAHKFPERRAQMDLLLGAAEAVSNRMDFGLEIFSRFLGDDERYQFPDGLADRVVGSLPYRSLLTAYKHYKVFLNVNSVVDSPSMCARRIFEISASGTPVVTTPSAATKRFFEQDEVPQPETKSDAEWTLRALVRSQELRSRIVHKAQRRIWNEHTYSHRAMTVMKSIGVDFDDPLRTTVSAVVSTNRREHLSHVIETHAAQSFAGKQLILVAHGIDVPKDLFAQARDLGIDHFELVRVDATETLGTCLNRGIQASDGQTIAKMDDDDLYGRHYLSDQLAALRYSGADLVGKQAHYLHLRSRNIVMCRFPEREHRFTDLVMGPTLVGARELFRKHQFEERTVGEDTELQQRLISEGARIYSADRFNFVQVRGDHGHTWTIDDNELLANSDVHSFGFNPDHYLF